MRQTVRESEGKRVARIMRLDVCVTVQLFRAQEEEHTHIHTRTARTQKRNKLNMGSKRGNKSHAGQQHARMFPGG